MSIVEKLVAGNFLVGTIKGNPYDTHAKEMGAKAAACGKKPGGGPGTRSGWYLYKPSHKVLNCKKCIAAVDTQYSLRHTLVSPTGDTE